MVAMERDLALVRRSLDVRGRAAGRIFTSKIFIKKQSFENVSVVGPVLGAPHAVMVLEKLIVLGAEKIVFLGWCGSVHEEAFIGDFLVPDCAIIGEGTSGYYVSDRKRMRSQPSPKILNALLTACKGHSLIFHKGPVWSTDAPFRETPQLIETLKRKKVLGVDMETSALFTVSRFRKVKTGALLVVSDELATLTWKPGFTDRRFNRARNKASEIIAETCRRISSTE
jgi:uridine phosphorylase